MQHKSLDTITLFHRPSLSSSTRVLTLLKQASAQASETATEDQASNHSYQNKIQRSEFELNITEEPPTSDQLKSILEYVGGSRAKDVVEGARNEADAIKSLAQDPSKFRAPVVRILDQGRMLISIDADGVCRLLTGAMVGLVSMRQRIQKYPDTNFCAVIGDGESEIIKMINQLPK